VFFYRVNVYIIVYFVFSELMTPCGACCGFARGLRRDCQLLLFSATYDDQVMRFAESVVHDAIIIKLKREEQSLDNIKQYYIECTSLEDKFSALSNIYGSISIGQSMIFCHVSLVLLASSFVNFLHWSFYAPVKRYIASLVIH